MSGYIDLMKLDEPEEEVYWVWLFNKHGFIELYEV